MYQGNRTRADGGARGARGGERADIDSALGTIERGYGNAPVVSFRGKKGEVEVKRDEREKKGERKREKREKEKEKKKG